MLGLRNVCYRFLDWMQQVVGLRPIFLLVLSLVPPESKIHQSKIQNPNPRAKILAYVGFWISEFPILDDLLYCSLISYSSEVWILDFGVSDFAFLSTGHAEYPLDTPTRVSRSFSVCPHGCSIHIVQLKIYNNHILVACTIADPASLRYGAICDTLVVGNSSQSEKIQSKRFRNATHLRSSSLQCLA